MCAAVANEICENGRVIFRFADFFPGTIFCLPKFAGLISFAARRQRAGAQAAN
jgi:hypothetical protein